MAWLSFLLPTITHAHTLQGWKQVNQMMLHKVRQFLYKQY